MDIKDIVVTEFKSVFERHHYPASSEFLRIAESPFDLAAVQCAIDDDVKSLENQMRFFSSAESQKMVEDRMRVHEKRLRQLAREYALSLLSETRRGIPLNESSASSGQANLKAQAGGGCDVYPCMQQSR